MEKGKRTATRGYDTSRDPRKQGEPTIHSLSNRRQRNRVKSDMFAGMANSDAPSLGLLYKRLMIAELERLTEANRNILKVRLRELVQAEQIAKHGQARATWYSLGEKR